MTSQRAVALLEARIDALRPIIWLETADPVEADVVVAAVVAAGSFSLECWDCAGGRVHPSVGTSLDDVPLAEFLGRFDLEDWQKRTLIVVRDLDAFIAEPRVVALLRTLAVRAVQRATFNVTIVVIASTLRIPAELEKLITILPLPGLDDSEVSDAIHEFASAHGCSVTPTLTAELVLMLRGLTRFEVGQILALAYEDGGVLDDRCKAIVVEEKRQAIRKSGLLDLIDANFGFASVGGLDALRDYLKGKGAVFKRLPAALAAGVDIPKGILVVGMPGCGKSMIAKATAHLFGLPLLRLDVGRLLGKYVGESEENLRRAIRVTESVSPCVLWIDEVEKAFAGAVGDDGGGVAARMFGFFLTWLQEKTSTVYVVATANAVKKIPPEFQRKGRFDEVFFVDFPSAQECREICEIHLEKRRQRCAPELDLGTVSKQMARRRFSGAEIEAVIKDAVEHAFLADRRLDREIFNHMMLNTKTVSEVREPDIKEMREMLEKSGFRPATRPVLASP
jgi:hypothetical protein